MTYQKYMLVFKPTVCLLRHIHCSKLSTIYEFNNCVDRLVLRLSFVRDLLTGNQLNLKRIKLSPEEIVQNWLVPVEGHFQIMEFHCLHFIEDPRLRAIFLFIEQKER